MLKGVKKWESDAEWIQCLRNRESKCLSRKNSRDSGERRIKCLVHEKEIAKERKTDRVGGRGWERRWKSDREGEKTALETEILPLSDECPVLPDQLKADHHLNGSTPFFCHWSNQQPLERCRKSWSARHRATTLPPPSRVRQPSRAALSQSSKVGLQVSADVPPTQLECSPPSSSTRHRRWSPFRTCPLESFGCSSRSWSCPS